MLICPDCQKKIAASNIELCKFCGWAYVLSDGVPNFLSTKDKSSLMINDYVSNYDQIASDDINHSILDDTYVTHQVNKVISYITDIEGANICDVGCGKGKLTSALLDAGAGNVTGVDITTEYIKKLSFVANAKFVLANAENLPFKEEFDIITCTDVLEHVLNLGSALSSIYDSLKPNGTAYIRVPYQENLMPYSRKMKCKYEFVHLRNFNKSLLKKIIKDAGFDFVTYHLDGFNIQTPNPNAYKYKWQKYLYNRWSQKVQNKLENISDVASWSYFPWRFIMKPQEIVVVVRKPR